VIIVKGLHYKVGSLLVEKTEPCMLGPGIGYDDEKCTDVDPDITLDVFPVPENLAGYQVENDNEPYPGYQELEGYHGHGARNTGNEDPCNVQPDRDGNRVAYDPAVKFPLEQVFEQKKQHDSNDDRLGWQGKVKFIPFQNVGQLDREGCDKYGNVNQFVKRIKGHQDNQHKQGDKAEIIKFPGDEKGIHRNKKKSEQVNPVGLLLMCKAQSHS
jgi:hypothetical protein